MTKYWFVSWDQESIDSTIQNGSAFGFLGARRLKGKSTGKTKSGRDKKVTKNGRATYLHRVVEPGDCVIIGNAPDAIAFAAVKVDSKIQQNGEDNIVQADSVWPNGTYTATHCTRVMTRCSEGADVSEFKRENVIVKGRMEFGVNLGDGHKGKAGVVRQIEKSDFEGMCNLINQKVTVLV